MEISNAILQAVHMSGDVRLKTRMDLLTSLGRSLSGWGLFDQY
jgi:hypothetical protein